MGFKVSKEAQNDLLEIGRYSKKKWGIRQRNKYLSELDRMFGQLADNPHLGRKCDHIRMGYCRYEHASHIIFYKFMDSYILISRILYKGMDVKSRI